MTLFERVFLGAVALLLILGLIGCAAMQDAAQIAKTAAKACRDGHC